MSTSIGVSAPSIHPWPTACKRGSAAAAARPLAGTASPPARQPALGDSAAIAALELLKPQFSPTRNAPHGRQIARLAAPSGRGAEDTDIATIFRSCDGAPAPFLTRLARHVRRRAQAAAGERRFGSALAAAARKGLDHGCSQSGLWRHRGPRRGGSCGMECRCGCPGAGAGHGEIGSRRLAGPLRHPAGRAGRAMRPDPERDRRGPPECRPDRHRAEDRRPEEPADARARAARRAAAVRARAEDRQDRRRPRRLRALPAERLRRRGRRWTTIW